MKILNGRQFNRFLGGFLLIILILLVIIGINSRDRKDFEPKFLGYGEDEDAVFSYGEADMMMDGVSANADVSLPGRRGTKMIAPAPTTGGLTAAETDDPKIIKTAELHMDVNGVPEKTADIGNLATSQGGFVENSTIIEDEAGYKTSYITVRVPVDTFDATVAAIKDLAVRINRESVNGRDVTEQYTDLEARLRSAQAQEEQYLTILQQAQNVTEILAVQQYLQNIRYEIESLQGQIESLGNQTEYSTIQVTLTEEVRLQAPAEEFDLGRDIKTALQTVVLLAQAALTFLVYFVIVGAAIVLPLGLVVALVVWVIRKIVRRL